MSYHDFCIQVAPSVAELQREYSKMNIEEFGEFRKEVIQEVKPLKLSEKFMNIVLDMIYNNLFKKGEALREVQE